VWLGLEFAPNNTGATGPMPCGRCGAHDTSYEDRAGITRRAAAVDWLRNARLRLSTLHHGRTVGALADDRRTCDETPF